MAGNSLSCCKINAIDANTLDLHDGLQDEVDEQLDRNDENVEEGDDPIASDCSAPMLKNFRSSPTRTFTIESLKTNNTENTCVRMARNSVAVDYLRSIAVGRGGGMELDLRGWQLGDEGIEAFDGPLRRALTVDMGYNSLGPIGAFALADVLLHGRIEALNLEGNSIGPEGVGAIVGSLSALSRLLISGNDIGNAGVISIAAMLGHRSRLADIGLSLNHIGDAGAQALAAALTRGARIRWLSLWGNGVGDAGARAFATALVGGAALEDLCLGYNRVGKVGAKALAAAVVKSTELRKLGLVGNTIGEAGTKSFAVALEAKACGHSSLEVLHLPTGSIRAAITKRLDEAAQRRGVRLSP
eukprot:NODE_10033_length_1381_cov_7.287081.p1 GENE.NODE_10033_length_1381_cov_7.287081~~NODE_10033_length_1381_cov_7.287081.p1  ORF type:complete len:387 (-),score=95.73 NODE_10033_length_1381_cov_7.287081:219-1289(-)